MGIIPLRPRIHERFEMRHVQETFTSLLLCTLLVATNLVVQTWMGGRNGLGSAVDASEQVAASNDCKVICADYREDVPVDAGVAQMAVADVCRDYHKAGIAALACMNVKAEADRAATNLDHHGLLIRPVGLACAGPD
jgi:hypothetical protein